jgi:nucleoside-diphosphate-sugar epimerase
MKKILVSGATGFIGNYVIKELLKNNCNIIATSLNEEKARLASWFSSVKYIPFNLKEFNKTVDYYRFFDSPDILIHLAWEGLPNYKADFHLTENLPRHYFFLKNIVENGLIDLTVTGTCLEYGMQEGILSEKTKANPSNPYAIAKDTLRKELEKLQEQKRFHLKWVRLFYMYGIGQSTNSLLSQLDRALQNDEPSFNMSGGEQERDYLPVEKVAEYIVKIALQTRVTGIINCSSGELIKIKDLVQDYLKEKKKHIQLNLGYYPYTDYEPMRFWGDINKLKTIINND